MTDLHEELQQEQIIEKQPAKFIKFAVLFLLTLIIVLAIIGGFVFLKKQQKQDYYSNEQIKSLLVRINKLENKTEELQQKTSVPNVYNDIVNNKLLVLVKCNYLIHAANFVLLTDNNVVKALQLLSQAKILIADNTEFAVLNSVLGRDIAMLQAAAKINTEDQILQLKKIKQEILSLPQIDLLLATKSITTSYSKETVTKSPEFTLTNWKAILKYLASVSSSALQNLFVISDHKQPVNMLLSNEEFNNLHLLLELKFSQAELALMRQQITIYESCILEIENLLNVYYRQDVLNKSGVLKTLDTVKNFNSINDAVNINASIAAVNTALNMILSNNYLSIPRQQPQTQNVPAKNVVKTNSVLEFRT